MQFSTLLSNHGLDPSKVLVLRHRPKEKKLREYLRVYAASKSKMFDIYQQFQEIAVEKQMTKCDYVAAFIGHEPRAAAFVGIFENRGEPAETTSRQRMAIPEFKELLKFGYPDNREISLHFNLVRMDILADCMGKLIVHWPGERSWSRWGNSKVGLRIASRLQTSVFPDEM